MADNVYADVDTGIPFAIDPEEEFKKDLLNTGINNTAQQLDAVAIDAQKNAVLNNAERVDVIVLPDGSTQISSPDPVMITGQPRTQDSYSTIAPAVKGQPVAGLNGVYIQPSKNINLQMADPANPTEVTPEQAQALYPALNNPRYPNPDIKDPVEAVQALAAEEAEAIKPKDIIVAEDADPEIADIVTNTMNQTLDRWKQTEDTTPEFQEDYGDVTSGYDTLNLRDLNAAVDPYGYYTKYQDAWMAKAKEKYDAAIAAGDIEQANKIVDWRDNVQQRRTETSNIFEEAAKGNIQPLKALWEAGEVFTIDDLNTPEMIAVMGRTVGYYKPDGTAKTMEELSRDWRQYMRMSENSLFETGLKAANLVMDNMTPQEQYDQMMSMAAFKALKSTGYGSSPLGEQVLGIAGGTLRDPTTYFTFGLAPLVKTTVGVASKKVVANRAFQYLLNKISSSKGAGVLTGMTLGGVYSGSYNLAYQTSATELGLQDSVDYGQVAAMTGFGVALGGPLGYLFSGHNYEINNAMNRYITRQAAMGNSVTARQIMDDMVKNITDEKSLLTYMRNLGYGHKETYDLIQRAKDGGFKYNEKAGRWVDGKGNALKMPTEVTKVGRYERFDVGSKPYEERFGPTGTRTFEPQGGKIVDQEYVTKTAAETAAPKMSQWGGIAFNFLNKIPGANKVLMAQDTEMVYRGFGNIYKSFRSAVDEAEINTDRMRRAVVDAEDAMLNALRKTGAKVDNNTVNNVWRKRELGQKLNAVEERYFKTIDKYREDIIRRSVRNGLVDPVTATKWIGDKFYVPRVWNMRMLMSKDGAALLAKELANIKNINSDVALNIIRNITGEGRDESMKLLNNLAPSQLLQAMRKRGTNDAAALKSTHLHYNREIKIPREYERMLDPFMVEMKDRWGKFFEDTTRANALADRFGAKYLPKKGEIVYPKLEETIKAARKQGRNEDADFLQDYVWNHSGNPKGSVNQANMKNPMFSRMVNKFNTFQTVSKMGLAFIANATQAVNSLTMVAKGSKTLLSSPYNIVKSIRYALFKKPHNFSIAQQAGNIAEIDIANMAAEGAVAARIFDKEFTGILKPLNYLNENTKALKVYGFIPVEKMNRRIASSLGWGHIVDLHTQLQTLIAKGKGNTPLARKLERELLDLNLPNPRKAYGNTDPEIMNAVYEFNKATNFGGETMNLPLFWKSPWGRLLTKFKSFSFYQARFINRAVLEPASRGDFAPLVTLLASSGLFGNAAEVIRTGIKGQEYEENKNVFEAIVRGLSNAGGVGLLAQTLSDLGEGGKRSLGDLIAGPTVGQALDTARDLTNGEIDKVFKSMIPNSPATYWIKDKVSF